MSEGTSPEEVRNWIIIGVACFLVVVAIIFAICMIVRTKKSRKSRDLVSPLYLAGSATNGSSSTAHHQPIYATFSPPLHPYASQPYLASQPGLSRHHF